LSKQTGDYATFKFQPLLLRHHYEYARWSAGEAIAIRDFDHSRKVGEGLADAIREWKASSAKLAKAETVRISV
jgi:hypothetical protein